MTNPPIMITRRSVVAKELLVRFRRSVIMVKSSRVEVVA